MRRFTSFLLLAAVLGDPHPERAGLPPASWTTARSFEAVPQSATGALVLKVTRLTA